MFTQIILKHKKIEQNRPAFFNRTFRRKVFDNDVFKVVKRGVNIAVVAFVFFDFVIVRFSSVEQFDDIGKGYFFFVFEVGDDFLFVLFAKRVQYMLKAISSSYLRWAMTSCSYFSQKEFSICLFLRWQIFAKSSTFSMI